jgi:hypothetical protein
MIPWNLVIPALQAAMNLAITVIGKPGNSLHDTLDPTKWLATLPAEHCATLAQLGALCAPPAGDAPQTLVPDPPAGG